MTAKEVIKEIIRMPSEFVETFKVYFLSNHANKTAFRSDSRYRSYIRAQIKKSYSSSSKTTKVNLRTSNLVGIVSRKVTLSPDQRVLCVGCRTPLELDFIENTLHLKATGLDLFSLDPRIQVGDMHKMPFSDNEFDHLYSCHSLEHAFDLDKVLSEFIRVVRVRGSITIEMPVSFKPNETDYWDLGTYEYLKKKVEKNIGQVLHEENGSNAGNETKRVIRLIFTVKK